MKWRGVLHMGRSRGALTGRAAGGPPIPNVGGLQRPHAILPAHTTCVMRATRAAPGRAAECGHEATARDPDLIHGCAPRPSTRVVSGDARFWTGVCDPAPHKMLRPQMRRVEGEGCRVPWSSLAAGRPSLRRAPGAVPARAQRGPHVEHVRVRSSSRPRAPRIPTDLWRAHHAAVAHVIYGDTLKSWHRGADRDTEPVLESPISRKRLPLP